MGITEVAIRKPVMAWMVMAALIFFGFVGYSRLGISQMPDVDFPTISISVAYPGSAPEIVESDVVNILENAVMGVEGVKSISSSCRNGSARISIEFELNRKIDAALQEVQTKVTQAQRLLPQTIDPPVISKSNPEDQPIIWLALTSTKHSRPEIMTYVRDTLKDKFSSLPGVGDIMLGGYIDPALRVWVNKYALNKYAFTVQDVINSIQNEHIEIPAGKIDDPKKQYTIRTLGEAKDLHEFEKIRINSRGGQPNYIPIYLKELATVESGLADVNMFSRANGKTAVGMAILKQRGSNAVEVGNEVKKRLAEINKALPPGMNLSVRVDTTKFINEAIKDLLFTLILSVFLTSLVCWLFLGSWSATLNVLLAIPTSVVGTFLVLYFLHFTLNTFTLMALSLSIGIVVDDAIMVLENIIRHHQLGKTRMESAKVGTREITFAALAATFSIIAIFLPIAFMKGIIGKFFFQFGVTMTVAVLLSLFEALTLTPMRCSQFLNDSGHTTRFGKAVDVIFNRIRDGYSFLLKIALNHRVLVFVSTLIIFVLSFSCLKYIRKEFVPAQDQSMFQIRVKAPAGSSVDYTNEKVKQVEAFLLKKKECEGYFATIGGNGGNDPTAGMIFVTLKPKFQRGFNTKLKKFPTQQDLMNMWRGAMKKKINGCKVSFADLSMRSFSSGSGFPIEFTVRGPDWDVLGESALKIFSELEKNPHLTDVGTDYLLGNVEYAIVPDRQLASAYGVSMATIGQTIQAFIGGVKVARYQSGTHRYDIVVKLPENDINKNNMLEGLNVRNNRGELIPLVQVVRITKQPALQSISRIDRERAITIYSNVKTGYSQNLAIKEVEVVAAKLLPAGYRIVMTGNAQASRESSASLLGALLLGIAVAYMILASQFNSYKHPIIVLIALPFSVTGAFLALLLTNQSLNLYSMIGLILLMGIVKKNSILLVDFTNQVREKGRPVKEALLEACPIRLRPILMTSLATIAGALPSALALGPGAETRIPMATAVIGGVIVSTALTLFVVPCFYSLICKDKPTAIAKK